MDRLAAIRDALQRALHSRWLGRAGAAVFVLSIPMALVGSNVRYLFGEERLYTFAIKRYDVAAVSGIPEPALLRAAQELRAYLFGRDEYLRIEVTDGAGRPGPLFNPREALHMRDVRGLVQGIFRAQEAALLAALAYAAVRVLAQRRAGARAVAALTWKTALAFNLIAVAFGVTAALSFDQVFTQFHQLSFSNDLWQLDPTRDHLVQMFPFPFWQLCAGLLAGMTLLESALLVVGARWYLSRSGAVAPAPEGLTAGLGEA